MMKGFSHSYLELAFALSESSETSCQGRNPKLPGYDHNAGSRNWTDCWLGWGAGGGLVIISFSVVVVVS
jgi:hypothetical protein